MRHQIQVLTDRITRPYIWVFISIILLSLSITACDPGDRDFLIEMGKEWATEHKVMTEDGGINWVTAGEKVLFGTTGDPEADAALDAGLVVHTLETADNLAQEGAESGDMDKIQTAIGMRPGDWSYHEQKGALLLAQGDMDGADRAFGASIALVTDRINSGGDCTSYALNMLRHREQALLTQLNRKPTGDLDRRLQSVRAEITMLEMNNPIGMCP